jgi:hypothetical protein
MQPNTQEAPGYFVWQAPGKPLAVYLSLHVVERLNADVMRGLAAVPKRGAEVGGVLLGSIEPGETTIVRVEDFQAIACAYGRGPSFFLSETEQQLLGSVAEEERPADSGVPQAVGYYRSHTREGTMALGPEDLECIGKFFPDVNQVALLVRPFATKVGIAGFFVRENGSFPGKTPLEFPFRRREMLGEEAPARRSMYDRKPRNRERREESYEVPVQAQVQASDYAPAYDYAQDQPTYVEVQPERLPRKQRSPWTWLPIVFIFFVLGAALGYQTAVTLARRAVIREGATAFALRLAAERTGESLSVRWDRDSSAVRVAQRGMLEIVDGSVSKPVPLDTAQLREGSVIYQNMSRTVRFRLVIFVGENATVNETVTWQQ